MRFIIALFALAFSLGWLAHEGIDFMQYTVESPTGYAVAEQASPGNWVDESEIIATADKVVAAIPRAYIVRYTNTNSMDPMLDETSTGIEIPYNNQELQAGDVISYEHKGILMVHRIAAIEESREGKTFLMQGDNQGSIHAIPEKAIRGVLVGVFY